MVEALGIAVAAAAEECDVGRHDGWVMMLGDDCVDVIIELSII